LHPYATTQNTDKLCTLRIISAPKQTEFIHVQKYNTYTNGRHAKCRRLSGWEMFMGSLK